MVHYGKVVTSNSSYLHIATCYPKLDAAVQQPANITLNQRCILIPTHMSKLYYKMVAARPCPGKVEMHKKGLLKPNIGNVGDPTASSSAAHNYFPPSMLGRIWMIPSARWQRVPLLFFPPKSGPETDRSRSGQQAATSRIRNQNPAPLTSQSSDASRIKAPREGAEQTTPRARSGGWHRAAPHAPRINPTQDEEPAARPAWIRPRISRLPTPARGDLGTIPNRAEIQ